ncbi:MAG: hypothetical protein ACOC1P_03180 [Minisyncoccales bacterium]
MTKKEAFGFIYGSYDYYNRVCSELEEIAKKRGFKSLDEALKKDIEFRETESSVFNKALSYFLGQIYLGIMMESFLISWFY